MNNDDDNRIRLEIFSFFLKFKLKTRHYNYTVKSKGNKKKHSIANNNM